MTGVAVVRSAMSTGLSVTTLALAGAAPSQLPARTGDEAPGTVQEAGQVPGVVGVAGQAPGTVQEAGQAPGTMREAGQGPETAMDAAAGGVRDPFARPVATGSGRPVEGRPSGLSGVAVDEVVLRGVVTTRDGRLAVLEGPDGRAWVARPGERLHDGAVQGITAEAVLLLRDAADSVAERVVGKRLRDGESAR